MYVREVADAACKEKLTVLTIVFTFMRSLRLAIGVSAASSLGVEEIAAAAAGVCGFGVAGLGGGVFVISPNGFRTPELRRNPGVKPYSPY